MLLFRKKRKCWGHEWEAGGPELAAGCLCLHVRGLTGSAASSEQARTRGLTYMPNGFFSAYIHLGPRSWIPNNWNFSPAL